MARKKTDTSESESELQFPVEGLDEQRSYSRQRPGTTADAMNVRAFSPLKDRATGASRPGHEKVYFLNDDTTGSAVDQKPIQDINQLTTTATLATPAPVGHFRQFTYGEPAGTGVGDTGKVGIGDGDAGSSIAIVPAASLNGFTFALSTWDTNGFVYPVFVNTTTGAIRIYKYFRDGTPATTGTWPNTSLTCATGNIRNVCGLVALSTSYLFVALKPASGTSYIFRISVFTGNVVDGVNPWAQHDATFFSMVFSNNAVNVLAIASSTLGIELYSIGTNSGMAMFDPNGAPYNPGGTTVATRFPARLSFTSWSPGTAGFHSKVRVCSDGDSFYANASSGTGLKLYKMSAGGVVVGSFSVGSEILSVAGAQCYVNSGGVTLPGIAITKAVAPFVAIVNGSSMASLFSSGSPGSVAQWDAVDVSSEISTTAGQILLFRSGAATNNFMTVNVSVVAVIAMGFFDLPNANNAGISVCRAAGSLPPPAGPVKTVVILRAILVKGGQVMPFTEDGPRAITGGQAFNGVAPEILSAQNGSNLFYVDGGSAYMYYKGSTDTVVTWTPTAGSLPLNANGSGANLICTWRGRTVLVVERSFYMSKQNDPFDWNYAPQTTTQQQAFAGNADLAGSLGNFITCIIPFNDDVMVFGCDHAIYQLSGDPMANGQMDRVVDGLGIANGRPFAFDTKGILYFMGSDCNIYKMSSGSIPEPISGQIRKRLMDIDLSVVRVRLVWDTLFDGLGVYVTPVDPTEEATNYFWEHRTGAWWPEKFGNVLHQPQAVFMFDGDLPEDRRLYIGGRDGFVRRQMNDGGDDAGTAIDSTVLIGPIMSGFDDMILRTLQTVLTEDSGEVRYDVYWGKHAEEAFNKAMAGDSVIHGTWKAGRGRVSPINREGFAFYVRLSSSDYWAVDRIRQTFGTLGAIRRRQ